MPTPTGRLATGCWHESGPMCRILFLRAGSRTGWRRCSYSQRRRPERGRARASAHAARRPSRTAAEQAPAVDLCRLRGQLHVHGRRDELHHPARRLGLGPHRRLCRASALRRKVGFERAGRPWRGGRRRRRRLDGGGVVQHGREQHRPRALHLRAVSPPPPDPPPAQPPCPPTVGFSARTHPVNHSHSHSHSRTILAYLWVGRRRGVPETALFLFLSWRRRRR